MSQAMTHEPGGQRVQLDTASLRDLIESNFDNIYVGFQDFILDVWHLESTDLGA